MFLRPLNEKAPSVFTVLRLQTMLGCQHRVSLNYWIRYCQPLILYTSVLLDYQGGSRDATQKYNHHHMTLTNRSTHVYKPRKHGNSSLSRPSGINGRATINFRETREINSFCPKLRRAVHTRSEQSGYYFCPMSFVIKMSRRNYTVSSKESGFIEILLTSPTFNVGGSLSYYNSIFLLKLVTVIIQIEKINYWK